MDNIVEYLRAESTSDCVAYTEFILQYKKGENNLYCFFEGFEDRTYYSIRIENITEVEKYYDFVCGGKDGVKKVYDLIKSNQHYKDVKTSFFIDNDFDNESKSNGIYVTPTYSIENLYCTKEAFEKILISEFKMNRTDDDFNKCLDNYLKLQNQFNEEILIFNAWLSCQSDYRKENDTTTRLKIDKKTKAYFEKIVLPDLNSIKSIPEINTKENLEIIFEDSPIIDNEILNKKIDLLKQVNKTDNFRGKFLIRFLESYLSRLQSIFGVENTHFEKTYSCKLRIENATICSNLSQYASTPPCLKEYLKTYRN